MCLTVNDAFLCISGSRGVDGAEERRSPALPCQQPGTTLVLSLTKTICGAEGYKNCCVRRTCTLWGRVVVAVLQSSVVPGSWDVALARLCR